LEFRRDLWHQKTGSIAASSFFELVTKHACDRQTDRKKDGRTELRLPRPR